MQARPLSKSYPLVWRHDPALDQGRETFADDYDRALESLSWGPLTRPGEQPTLWWVKPLRGLPMETIRLIAGYGDLTPSHGILAFRACLQRVEHCDGLGPLHHVGHPGHPDVGPLLSPEVMATIDELGVGLGHPLNAIAIAIGTTLLLRSLSADPK